MVDMEKVSVFPLDIPPNYFSVIWRLLIRLTIVSKWSRNVTVFNFRFEFWAMSKVLRFQQVDF